MEKLKEIKHCLVQAVQTEMMDIKNANTEELGEVIDMIKDISKAIYYCSIVEAMETQPTSHSCIRHDMSDLETYMNDFSEDLTDMVKESTAEEKQVVSSKLQSLATKINK